MKIVNREQAVQTVTAFLSENHKATDVIKYCNLHPVLPSWKKWTDHVGNSLIINDNKTIRVLFNDPLKRQETIITDIFQKAHPISIAHRSKWAFVAFGSHNCENINACLIWFLGHDDRLRFTSLVKGEWLENRPPLGTGFDILSLVLQNLELDKKIDIINVEVLGVKIKKAWACQLPLNNLFTRVLLDFRHLGDFLDGLRHQDN